VLLDTDESRKLGYELAGKQLLDQQLTSFLFRDFQKQNQIAWGSASSVDAEHIYNGQWFSAHGYSWLRPLRHFLEGTAIPCPTVFDVRAEAASLADVEAFCARIKRAGDRPRSKLRLLGVMAARFFEPDAFVLGKEYGLILVNLQQSIGDEALETLAIIDKILAVEPTAVAPAATADFVDLFKKLRYHPQAKNLAGLAFESFSASVLQANGWSDVRTNLAVPFRRGTGATSRDVDVSGRQGDRYLIVECKAHAGTKPVERDDVLKFFDETAPSFLKYMAPRQPVKTLQAEFWTTGQVPAEYQELLEGFETKHGIYECVIRTADQIEIPNHISSMRPLLKCIAEL
jgi:hypothetical protein